ncbi:DUF262 domain-containing protein [Xanthomonas campestris pv. badrii]|uniref:DUF262 domain-containing protein n=1 Tax=Xanthomonas campestris pv. badrii TaxID=149696 RepID=A0A7Z2V7E7_XANCA|nr:DUF262 domain-containing protein [Xanthomonas campestris]QJD66446.1 DUF262 domain-containing protein [Xanthomonas campestris pv. badrii]
MTADLNSQFDSQRKKVDVDNFDVTVRELVRMVEEGEIDRAPEYQRKFRWDETRESKLVESVLLGLPVPTVFMATNKDGTWELVDGLQRISSLVHFAGSEKNLSNTIGKTNSLKLCGLEKLSSFNGKTFLELPESIQLHLMKRALRVTSLSDKSDMNVRFDTFERLNTGGIELSSQEIRACVYQGALSDFLSEAAQDKGLARLIKLQKGHQDDGTMEEFILKIFAYSNARDHFDGQVTSFLNNFARDNQSLDSVGAMRTEFSTLIKRFSKIHPGAILKENYSVTPLNLAEGVLVGALELSRKKVKLSPVEGWLRDRQLLKLSTGGTNTKKSLHGRIDRAKELLQGAKPGV